MRKQSNMYREPKILLLVFLFLILSSIGILYLRLMVRHDYIAQAEVECDPYTENCFVYICDSTLGEECTGDPILDTSYYKIISRNIKNSPRCDSRTESCDVSACGENEEECSYIFCDAVISTGDVVCSNPVSYAREHPLELEESTDEETSMNEGVIEGTVSQEEE